MPSTPDPRAARVAVAATFFAFGILFGTWASRIPAIKRSVELSDGELGLALLGIAVGAIVAMPLVGRLVSRRGSRNPTTAGLLVCSALLVPPAFAPDLPVLVGALIVLGAATGGLDVSMNSHGLAVERLYRRPILTSFHAAFSAGGLAGAAVGGLVAGAGVGPEAHFAGAAGLCAGGALAVRHGLLPSEEDAGGEAAPAFALPTHGLVLVGVIAFCCLFGEGVASDWSAVFLSESIGTGDGVAPLAFAAFSIAMTVGRLVGDRLTARWGAPTLARRSALLAAAGLTAALVVQTTAVAIIGFACLGAGLASVFPLALRAGGGATGIAAVATAGYTGFLVGAPTIGGAAEVVGLPAALGIVVGLIAVFAALAPALAPQG